jgi:hypothetical protein
MEIVGNPVTAAVRRHGHRTDLVEQAPGSSFLSRRAKVSETLVLVPYGSATVGDSSRPEPIESPPLIAAQPQVRRGDVLPQVVDGGGARNRQHDR